MKNSLTTIITPTPASPMNDWADFWRCRIGVNVIPANTKNKATNIQWSNYQDKPIPPEMHEHWKRNDRFKDGMAIILGKVWHNPSKEGLNLVFVDLDNKKAIEEFCSWNGRVQSLEELAKHMIIEQHKDDPDKAHAYFYSKLVFPKKSSDKTGALCDMIDQDQLPAIEVKGLGEHGIAFCTPSLHRNGQKYEIIGTLEPEIIDEMSGHIDSICRKYNISYLDGRQSNTSSLIPITDLFKPETMILEGHNRHQELLRVMESMIRRNQCILTKLKIKSLAIEWNQQHCVPPLNHHEFEKLWKEATNFIQKKTKEIGGEQKSLTSSSKEPSLKPIYLPRISNKDWLAEAIIIDEIPRFLVTNNGTGDIHIVDSISLDKEEKTAWPLKAEQYINKPYSFSSQLEVDSLIQQAKKETFDSLYRMVKAIWKKYVASDDFHISICAADTIFTYHQDKAGMTHYLFFVGGPGSGKSNNLEIFHFLAYRNMTSTSITPANIYRFYGGREEGVGTICEDEANDLDENEDKMRFYKNGYTTGRPVFRQDEGDSGRVPQRFFTFGFKVFAAERLPDSVIAKGFLDRTLVMKCVYGFPDYDITEITNPMGDEKFSLLLQELEKMRNLLLIHRMVHYHDKFPDIKLNITGREKQLFKPLLRIFNKTETQKELEAVISNYINERRAANVDSLHAFVYRMVNELIGKTESYQLASKEIWTQVYTNLSGEFLYKGNTTFESVEFGPITQKKITSICKEVLGASLGRDTKERKLVFDKNKLGQLEKLFSLSLELKASDMTDMTDMTHFGLDRHLIAPQQNEEILEKNALIKNNSNKSRSNDQNLATQNNPVDAQVSGNPSYVSYVSYEAKSEQSTCPTCGEKVDPDPYYAKLHKCGRTNSS